jgi:CheY-like chemotaxis protein
MAEGLYEPLKDFGDDDRLRILVVDDNVWDARLMRRLLEARQRFEVLEAHSAEEAMRAIESCVPDLIILDLILPDKNGEEILITLQANEETRSVPVIIVSAKDIEPQLRAQLAQHADSVWTKGALDRNSFLAHVETILTECEMMEKNILHIEDSFHNRRIVRKILAPCGYSVFEAEDGIRGYEMIREMKPPLILLDIALPGMDGIEIVKLVKADWKLRDIPVIALTASAMRGDRERFLEAGCDDYLSKPFKAAELIEMVDNYFNNPNGNRKQMEAFVDAEDNGGEGDAPIETAADPFEVNISTSNQADAVEENPAIDLEQNLEEDIQLTNSEREMFLPAENTRDGWLTAGIESDEFVDHMMGMLEYEALKPPNPNGDSKAYEDESIASKGIARQERPNVLIVDDNLWDARLIRRLLSAGNRFKVTEVYSGKQALEAVDRKVPDVIILDLILQDVSGEDLLIELRTRKELENVPIVIVTIREIDADERAKLLVHADSVWSKESLDVRKLAVHVDKMLVEKG